jgi:hypothetical protein
VIEHESHLFFGATEGEETEEETECRGGGFARSLKIYSDKGDVD